MKKLILILILVLSENTLANEHYFCFKEKLSSKYTLLLSQDFSHVRYYPNKKNIALKLKEQTIIDDGENTQTNHVFGYYLYEKIDGNTNGIYFFEQQKNKIDHVQYLNYRTKKETSFIRVLYDDLDSEFLKNICL
ncbi:hypothetical protein [Lonepinella sp. MS14435]|uniref:hypothetical protein n=1 Tax=Lonepinella sp. MS14435 TaxID=3003618 RepID=UPI0036DCC659